MTSVLLTALIDEACNMVEVKLHDGATLIVGTDLNMIGGDIRDIELVSSIQSIIQKYLERP